MMYYLDLRTRVFLQSQLSRLFSLPAVDFTKALLKPRLKVGTDYVKDIEAICKASCERLFNYFVIKVNNALNTRAAHNFSYWLVFWILLVLKYFERIRSTMY